MWKKAPLYCALGFRRKSPARRFQYKSVFRAAQTQKIACGPPAEHVGWFEGVGVRARRRGWLVLGLGVVPGLRNHRSGLADWPLSLNFCPILHGYFFRLRGFSCLPSLSLSFRLLAACRDRSVRGFVVARTVVRLLRCPSPSVFPVVVSVSPPSLRRFISPCECALLSALFLFFGR